MTVYLQYAWILLRRYKQHPSLRFVFHSLFAVIVCLNGMTLLSARLSASIQENSLSLMGADRVMLSNRIIQPDLIEQAQSLGLRTSVSIGLITMLANQTFLSLADIKGVQSNYPLLGSLKISGQALKARKTHRLPDPGTVWIEQRLLSELHLDIGDPISIGAHIFSIGAVLLSEPTKILEGTSYAPMVLMNQSELGLTGLASPTDSNLTYTLLLAGPAKACLSFDQWLGQAHRLSADQLYMNAEVKASFIQSLLSALDLYQRIFFPLSFCLAFIVSLIAFDRFRASELPSAAIFRCFGAEPIWISLCVACMLCIRTLITASLGIFMGILLAYGLESLYFSEIVSGTVSYRHGLIRSIGTGFLSAFCLMAISSMPMLYSLYKTPSTRIVQDLKIEPQKNYKALLIACFMGAGLLIGIDMHHQKAMMLFMLLLFSFASLAFLGLHILLTIAGKMTFLGPTFSALMHTMRGRSKEISLQIIAISLIVGLSLSLCIIKNKLSIPWKERTQEDAHNYFLIGIPKHAQAALEAFLIHAQIPPKPYYPMTVARLMAVNQAPVSMDPMNTKNRVWPKALRLSSMPVLKPDNTLIAGQWFGPADYGKAYASVESRFAQYLGIRLGDQLTMTVDQDTLRLVVTSIREVDWSALQPNFLIMVPEGFLDAYSKSYMTSLYIPLKKNAFLGTLLTAFPMISIIDIAMIVTQTHTFIQSALDLFQTLWLVNLSMCLIVSYFLVAYSAESRRQESHLIRLLGATQKTITLRRFIEYGLLGSLVFVLGIVIAYGTTWAFY